MTQELPNKLLLKFDDAPIEIFVQFPGFLACNAYHLVRNTKASLFSNSNTKKTNFPKTTGKTRIVDYNSGNRF